VTDHDELQSEIPAYVASRLEEDARRRLEDHLRDCDACAEMVEAWRTIAPALRDGGEAIFTPHPPARALREYALGRGEAVDPAHVRHVASCDTCDLEIRVWKEREGGVDAPAGAALWKEQRTPAWRPTMALAAGAVLGAAIAAFMLRRPTLPGPAAPPTPEPIASRLAEGIGEPVPLWVLAGPLRGETPVATFTIGREQPYVLIAVRPALAPGAADADIYRFEIHRPDGGTSWSSEADVARIRSHMESSGVVTFPVPTTDLPPGRYFFRLERRAPAGDEKPLLEIPFEILPGEAATPTSTPR